MAASYIKASAAAAKAAKGSGKPPAAKTSTSPPPGKEPKKRTRTGLGLAQGFRVGRGVRRGIKDGRLPKDFVPKMSVPGIEGISGRGRRVGAGLGYFAGRHPWEAGATGAAIGIPAALWAAQGGVDTAEGMMGTNEDAQKRLMLKLLLENAAEMQAAREQQQLVDANTQRIMMMRPDLAQSLLAGRRLPPGGRMFGGTPQVDVLEAVAAAMANGTLDPEASSGGDPLEGLLAGM